jgi:hypothetical protein
MFTLTILPSLYSTIHPRYVHFDQIALSLFYNPPTICSLSPYCPLFILQSTHDMFTFTFTVFPSLYSTINPRYVHFHRIDLSLFYNQPTIYSLSPYCPLFILQSTHDMFTFTVLPSLYSTIHPRYVHFHCIALSLFCNPLQGVILLFTLSSLY